MSPFTDLTTCMLSVTRKHQTGAALIVSLMLLIVLTLLGLSGMQSTIMQERMSNNVRDKGMAFQAAESALRGGENWVKDQGILTPQNGGSCTAPCDLVHLDDYIDMITQDFTWWKDNGRAYVGMPTGTVASAPRFIVEEHGTARQGYSLDPTASILPPRLYRITAIGVGSTTTAEAMIETLYARND
ncbi:hypothetical protein MNBD_GAMMA19-721 [hydrothermal vent metagenome]|uniref:Type IV fimbrial biogenesis protein PilX n=1 Tax=hydrothermal vent metagenome TaxID=652676 RepID=A0A3B1AAI4_9ZZZZ